MVAMDEPAPVRLELELPGGEHRERLLDALGNLIRRRGFETFVFAPILLPRSEYFPERWERNVLGARRLLRRLMRYAGLGEFRVRLASWQKSSGELGPARLIHKGDDTAALFAGFHDGAFDFALELDQLRHEESLVATLGHEVAHAYRDHHQLVISDRDLEEKLTDLTCVYLGFGVFALNASHAVETGGVSASGERLLYETRSLGYLSPSEFALLLGAQLAVRAERQEQREVAAELSANHAALVKRALREFGENAAELRGRFGIPDPAEWPARPALEPLAALPDEDEPPEPEPPDFELPEAAPVDAPGIVFRVRTSRAMSLGMLGLLSSAVLGVLLTPGAYLFYAICAAGIAAGVVLGKALGWYECSGCGTRLAPGAERCSGCKGAVVGEIRSREERLDAEERYLAERDEVAGTADERA
jgi:hypothetical protein